MLLTSQPKLEPEEGGKGRTAPPAPRAEVLLWLTSDLWSVLLAFPILLSLCPHNLKAWDLLIPPVASALACFLSRQPPQLASPPQHMVIKGKGAAGGAAVCAVCMGSPREAHVCDVKGHCPGTLADSQLQFCMGQFRASDLSGAQYLLVQGLRR